MHKDFAAITKRISGNIRTLREDIPDALKAFSALSQAATRSGALDKKTKELIALALGVAAHCDGCIGYHAEALVVSCKMTSNDHNAVRRYLIIALCRSRSAGLDQ